MTLNRKSRLIAISCATIGVASVAVFGYREWKMAQLERFWSSVGTWMVEHVFIPNDISVAHVPLGGGYNWLGVGKDCNMNFDTRTSDGEKLIMFVNFGSGPLSVKIRDMSLAIGGRDLPRDPNELATFFANAYAHPRPRALLLQEARTLDAHQWARLAAKDPLGSVGVIVPLESIPFKRHFYLHEELPGFFGRQSVETEVPIPLEYR